MNQREKLISLIGQQKYDEIIRKIKSPFNEEIQLSSVDWLLLKEDTEIINFYNDLRSNPAPNTILKWIGEIIILSTHVHALLQKLLQMAERDDQVKQQASELDFHHLIIFCAARFNFPDDELESLTKLRYYRNLFSHKFDETMETSFHQVIEPMAEGEVLVISLTDKIRQISRV
ncbi:MAG: hypothetical protein PHD05_05190 [Sphaerochaetaceae bacterium]|nr:hypothetical protein [Sphaerochaetaceae bacterium]